MSTRPRIAVSVSLEGPRHDRDLFKGKRLQYLEEEMILAVSVAGGLPLILPDLRSEDLCAELLEDMDGLLLTGGSDIAPQSYGEEPVDPAWGGDRRRDLYELALVQTARERDLPILGICRGCQLLNVAFGGTLWQDINTQRENSLVHRDPVSYDQNFHCLEISSDWRLQELLGPQSIEVNSVHHQGIGELGAGLRALAHAPDGIIEAIEAQTGYALGIQWHPEWLTEASTGQISPIFADFIQACCP
jgi:putative glutamine amidotransferase